MKKSYSFLLTLTTLFCCVSCSSSTFYTTTISSKLPKIKIAKAVQAQATSNTISYKGKSWARVGSSGAASNKFSEFNDPDLLTQWYSSYRTTSSNIEDLKKVQLTTLDLIFGNTEGNTTFNRSTKKWQLAYNLIMHNDPGFSARKDSFGKVNTGIISVNCFNDRPKDTILKPVCDNIFKAAGVTLEQVIAMSETKRRDFFYNNKMAIVVGNQHLSQLRNQSAYITDYLDNVGLGGVSTTIKLFYIDQVNQLGLAGAKRLANIDAEMLPLSREDLISRFRGLGIIDSENIFLTGYNQRIDFNAVPTSMLRVAFARVMWHNTRGNVQYFESGHTWLNQYAREWTYSSLKKDYPDMEQYIKEQIEKSKGKQNWANYRFTATGGPEDTIIVEVFGPDGEIEFTSKYKPFNAHYFTDQKVATSDVMRRLAQIPQSQAVYNAMKADTNRFLNKVYYPNFKMVRQ
jgi:hypothetical protein